MGWLDSAIRKGVKAGIEKGLAEATAPGGIIEQTIWSVMDEQMGPNTPLTELGFMWAIALRLKKAGCPSEHAKSLGRSVLRQYLADEKIKFGHPDYAWTREGAEAVAEEYELRHWEAA